MPNPVFPRQLDNSYRGARLAIGILVLVVIVDGIMGANSMIQTQQVIEGADGIPLGTFAPPAARIIVDCFKSWALGLFLMSALAAVALVRYRAMVPLMYLMLLLENAGRRVLHLTNPLRHARGAWHPSAGFWINTSLLLALLLGFVLSLLPRRSDAAPRVITSPGSPAAPGAQAGSPVGRDRRRS